MPHSWTRAGGTLDDVNADFHASYNAAREPHGEATPVLLLLSGQLILLQGAKREARSVLPPSAHALRSVAHAPVALFVSLFKPGARGEASPPPLDALQRRMEAGLANLGESLPDPVARPDAAAVFARCLALTREVSAPGRVAAGALETFARETGPLLLRLTEHATRIELAALHDAADAILKVLDPGEHARLQVLVAGAHQARDRSLGMQYFRKRLGEAEGSDERVTYAENVTSEAEALTLMGTRRLDRVVAGAFFGDPSRLQRDILGDAAAAQLARQGLNVGT